MRKNSKTWAALVILLMILCSACAVFVLGQGGTGRETPKTPAKKVSPRKKTPASRQSRLPTRKQELVSQKSLYERWRQNIGTDRKVAYEAANEYLRRFPNDTSENAQSIKRWVVDYEKVSHGPAPQQTSDEPKADDAAAKERTYWETIRLSTNAQDFKSYLEKYPNGQFAGLARYNLKRLEPPVKTPLKTDSAGRIILGSISGSSDKAPKPGSLVGNQIGMELVYVPAASFMMGSNNGQDNERPVHEVTIKEGFYIGRYEVTQAEWQQVMGGNPSHFKGDRLPVDQVSWEDAQSFIKKLNALRDGFKYGLPTEAEWEYACRAGTTTEFAFGNSLSSDQANFDGNNPYGGAAKGVSRQKTTAVGSFAPNAFGLYDMHGNVWEWCEDWSHETYAGAPTDGSAWLGGGEQEYRVLRGGSWSDYAAFLRSPYRRWFTPDDSRFDNLGLRVAAVVRTQ